MIKRLNFTGRKRIPRDRVDIEVYDGTPRAFDARIMLENIKLPPDAAVFLEASCAGSNVIQRFDYGRVGAIAAPQNPLLSEIEGENVFFTLKIVDQTERFGRILGVAENIRPERAGTQTAAGRRGILPIEEVELKQELWKLEFGEHDVCLLVNKNVPGIVDRVCSDPAFYAVVYPEVIRHVLQRAIAENVDLEEADDRWPVLWLKFGRSLHPERQEPPTPDDTEGREEWVEEVVSRFCEQHALADKFRAACNGETGED